MLFDDDDFFSEFFADLFEYLGEIPYGFWIGIAVGVACLAVYLVERFGS